MQYSYEVNGDAETVRVIINEIAELIYTLADNYVDYEIKINGENLVKYYVETENGEIVELVIDRNSVFFDDDFYVYDEYEIVYSKNANGESFFFATGDNYGNIVIDLSYFELVNGTEYEVYYSVDGEVIADFAFDYETTADGTVVIFNPDRLIINIPSIDFGSVTISAVPNSDPNEAYWALADAGYEVHIEVYPDPDEYSGLVAEVWAYVYDYEREEYQEIVVICYLDCVDDAEIAFEDLKFSFDMYEEVFNGLDLDLGISDTVVWYGTEAAIRAAR